MRALSIRQSKNLEKKLKEFMEVTSSQKQGRMPTRAQYDNSIPEDGLNVK